MSGFSFSPSLKNHVLQILLKNGKQIGGLVVDVTPAEVVIKVDNDSDRVVRINRDDVTGYTGDDGVERSSVSPKLIVTRCFNTIMKCNGIKKIDIDVSKINDCPLFNKECVKKAGDFFNMCKTSQVKLLSSIQIGKYPEKQKE
jgi:hypothetical protein